MSSAFIPGTSMRAWMASSVSDRSMGGEMNARPIGSSPTTCEIISSISSRKAANGPRRQRGRTALGSRCVNVPDHGKTPFSIGRVRRSNRAGLLSLDFFAAGHVSSDPALCNQTQSAYQSESKTRRGSGTFFGVVTNRSSEPQGPKNEPDPGPRVISSAKLPLGRRTRRRRTAAMPRSRRYGRCEARRGARLGSETDWPRRRIAFAVLPRSTRKRRQQHGAARRDHAVPYRTTVGD